MALAVLGAIVPWSALPGLVVHFANQPVFKNGLATAVAAVKSFPAMATNENAADYTYVYVGLVFMALVAVAFVSCVLGAAAGSAATWARMRRNRVQHLRPPVLNLDLHDGPDRSADNYEMAAFLRIGGEAALHSTAAKLGSTADSVREWCVAFQASKDGLVRHLRRD